MWRIDRVVDEVQSQAECGGGELDGLREQVGGLVADAGLS